MVQIIRKPFIIQAEGSAPKLIQEFVGNVATPGAPLSLAHMKASPGWTEPGQTPEFAEYTLVLGGTLVVETRDGQQAVTAGQAVIAPAGAWVRYTAPEGAEYIAVCLPAFTPDTVHRDR